MEPSTSNALERKAWRQAARRRRQTARMLVGAVGAASFIGTILVVHLTKVLEPARDFSHLPVASPNAMSGPASATEASAVDSSRPVFKYSIVPGGVRSGDEVVRAMQRDPVVAEHYARVIPAALRTETLVAPMSVSVSYRVGDQVFWTKKKLTLSKGEKVLTDGKTTLRERCGNILSVEPLGPSLEAEPLAPEFDLRIDPFAPTNGVGMLGDPPDPPNPPAPPPGIPPGSPTPFGLVPPPPPPPTPVPEPGTWLLIATGLGLGIAGLRRRARNN